MGTGSTTSVRDEFIADGAQSLTLYPYNNYIQSNITGSQYSLHTPHSFPDNFEIHMLNHLYTNTSSQTNTPNNNSGKFISPRIKYLK